MLLKLAYQLKQHQADALANTSPGQLLYFSTGSGKTLTSLAIAEKKGGRTSVITPAALRENYRKEIAKHRVKGNFNLASYQGFTKSPQKGKTLIIDEAHRLGSGKKMSTVIKNQARHFDKRVLMTATPIQNRPDELVPLLNTIEGRDIISKEKFNERFVAKRKIHPGFIGSLLGVKPGTKAGLKNKTELKELFRGRVNRFDLNREDFPDVTEEIIEVTIDPKQKKLYKYVSGKTLSPTLAFKIRHNLPASKKEKGQMNAFMTGTRQILNNPGGYSETYQGSNPKIKRMVDEIVAHDTPKTVIYSPYIDSGLLPVKKELDARGIKSEMFTGKLNDRERKELIARYNSGEIDTLLIGPSGSEGLDLKGTRLVQIMSPHWHNERIRQVRGRAIRIGSHDHLPKKERNVKVQTFLTVDEEPGRIAKFFKKKRSLLSDEYLRNLSGDKEYLNQEFLDAISP